MKPLARSPAGRKLRRAENRQLQRAAVAAAERAVYRRGHRLIGRSWTEPAMAAAEWRELLIRQASFELWRRWWPAIPEAQLRGAIGRCSLAVLIYCAHARLRRSANLPFPL